MTVGIVAPRRDGRVTRRLGRRVVVLVVAIVLAIAAGAVVTTIVVRHYSTAPLLRWGGDAGFMAPYDAVARPLDDLPQQSAYIIAGSAEPYGIYFSVTNPSSVTETVIGMTPVIGTTGRVTSTLDGRRDDDATSFDRSAAGFASLPIDIAPHATTYLRVRDRTPTCLRRDRSDILTSVTVQMRVGAFTREVDISFGATELELRGAGRGC